LIVSDILSGNLRDVVENQIICGPIIRRLDAGQLVLWWVSNQKSEGSFSCFVNNKQLLQQSLGAEQVSHFRIGEKAVVHLLDIQHQLPLDTVIEYELRLLVATGVYKDLNQQLPDICYPDQQRCSFSIESKLHNLLHGSCRNPQHSSEDSLLAGDSKLADTLQDVQQRPSILILSGDQIYADHVAGPMLFAIHKVIEILGLNDEQLPAGDMTTASQLHTDNPYYYRRKELLPLSEKSNFWRNGKQQNIFTSTLVHNHLLSFAEVNAMYLLVWSPQLWQQINMAEMPICELYSELQQQELATIGAFSRNLAKVQRLLAHISCYMIFDDHDVTDDWNLTAAWEKAAYENPLSKRIIGNALFSYWLFQGWGNDPQQFPSEFLQQADSYQREPNEQNQQRIIDTLYQFNHWHFAVRSSPKILVLDSRTQRWRSQSNIHKPSGLMDWESLCLLQQQLIGESAVILVSPAPIFGVKLIESVQRLATMLGQSLAVDAENWMAHPGSANTLLNIFRHSKTPRHFVILSGDVHYSFVYDIELRFRDSSPKIWQITSSGIKNQFPSKLVHILDKLNRYLYSVYSPLNLFTKRRDMKVQYREVVNHPGRRMIEKSGLGYLELNDDASPKHICDLHNDGSVTEFISHD